LVIYCICGLGWVGSMCTIPLLLLYEIVHEVHKKKEGRKKLNYDVQTYSISATISNGQKSDGLGWVGFAHQWVRLGWRKWTHVQVWFDHVACLCLAGNETRASLSSDDGSSQSSGTVETHMSMVLLFMFMFILIVAQYLGVFLILGKGKYIGRCERLDSCYTYTVSRKKQSHRFFSIILVTIDEFFKIKFGGLIPESTQDTTAIAFPL